jgi:hypothetical protein
VFDKTNANGLHGSWYLKNTGANSLNYRYTTTALDGTVTVVGPVTLAAGAPAYVAIEDTKVTPVPVTEVKLEVEDQVAGTHTTYAAGLSRVG